MILHTQSRPRNRTVLLMVAILVATVFAIGILGTGSVAADEEEYEVVVTVVDGDGEPVENIIVDLNGEFDETDANGEVIFTVAPGSYTIAIEAEGYETVSQSIDVDEDTSVEVTVERSDELDELREQLEALHDTIDSLEEERDRLQDERDELERERDDLQQQLDETDEQIAELQERLDAISNESMPGFGPLIAVIAILGTSLLAIRRY